MEKNKKNIQSRRVFILCSIKKKEKKNLKRFKMTRTFIQSQLRKDNIVKIREYLPVEWTW